MERQPRRNTNDPRHPTKALDLDLQPAALTHEQWEFARSLGRLLAERWAETDRSRTDSAPRAGN